MPGFGFTASSEGSVTMYILPYLPPRADLPKPTAQLAKACLFDDHLGFEAQHASMGLRIFFEVFEGDEGG